MGNRTMIALQTLWIKECTRFLRIWIQTLVPPAITMSLYFVIFGNLIGSRIGQMGGFSYMEFIVPYSGLRGRRGRPCDTHRYYRDMRIHVVCRY